MRVAPIIILLVSSISRVNVTSIRCIDGPCPYMYACNNARNDSQMCPCPSGRFSCSDNGTPGECDYSSLDLVFAIEVSAAGTSKNWPALVGLILSITDHLDVGNNSARVSLVTFGSSATIEIPLENGFNKSNLLNYLHLINYVQVDGETNVPGLLKTARTEAFGPLHTTRKRALIILISGGSSSNTELLALEANRAIKSGIFVFIIGVGIPYGQINTGYLRTISTDFNKRHVYTVNDRSRLKDKTPRLLDDLCSYITSDPCNDVLCSRKRVCMNYGPGHQCLCPGGIPGEECRDYADIGADIVFLLDASTSVQKSSWYKTLDFVGSIIRSLHLNKATHEHHIGVITFSKSAVNSMPLSPYMDLKSLVQSIEELPYIGGNTNTSGALRVMSQVFSPYNPNNRPSVENIGIIITDGRANVDAPSTFPEASKARLSGITILAVGIGQGVDRGYLDGLTGRETGRNNIFQVENFDDLDPFGDGTRNLGISEKMTDRIYDILWLHQDQVGPTGAKGTHGDTGVGGVEGPVGLPGVMGDIGSAGAQGHQGAPGIARVGLPGYLGLPGTGGETGELGSTGVQGPRGREGEPGLQGLQGLEGTRGFPGPPGPSGDTGVPGRRGSEGVLGLSGARGQGGEGGPQGVAGVQGVIGPPGPQGSRGLSGQQGAVGFTGDSGPPGVAGSLPKAKDTCDVANICQQQCSMGKCRCDTGYELRTDGYSCQDIDECLTNNGGCEQICQNKDGSKACACKLGFTLSKDKLTCIDYDECCDMGDHSVCRENKVCANTYGSYVCLNLPPGFKINPDTGALSGPESLDRILMRKEIVIIMIGWASVLTILLLITVIMHWLSDDIFLQTLAEGYKKALEIERAPKDFFLYPKVPLSAHSTERLNELCQRRSTQSLGQKYIDEHGFLTPNDPESRLHPKYGADDDNNNEIAECHYDPIPTTSSPSAEYGNIPTIQ